MANFKNNYIEQLVDHFRKNETSQQDYKLGIEFEHFLVQGDNLRAVHYYGNNGIENLLSQLTAQGWQVCKLGDEQKQIICLNKKTDEINLEPGGQIEFSFSPKDSIKEIEAAYLNVTADMKPILKENNYNLITLGYQPVTKIKELELLPKKRYYLMFEHFKKRGNLAHNMMLGTSSTQISLDYSSEEDFSKKFAVASWLSPIIYSTLDNTPIFEGKRTSEYAVRAKIWNDCDADRCGILDKSIEGNFTYRDYAEYIVNLPAIVAPEAKTEKPTDLKFKEAFTKEKLTAEDIELMLSFSFTDVRLKEYLEIRMADSFPLPLALGYLAFLKGIFYDQSNLDYVFKQVQKTTTFKVKKAIYNLKKRGCKETYTDNIMMADWLKLLIERSMQGLSGDDQEHLLYLKNYLQDYLPPRTAAGNTGNLKEDFDYSLVYSWE
ncbi:MAG: glutamate-cysteine ligase family protein [Halanaerobiaceae bacterium]